MPTNQPPVFASSSPVRSPGLLAVVALAALVVACGGGPEDVRNRGEREPPSVEAVPARSGSLPIEERFGGVVRALDQVEIRSEIESTVVEVAVRNGDAVRKGDVLVRLRDDALAEQLRQAEASLRVAEATAAEARARAAEVESRVVRTRELAEADLVSEMELEAREAELEVSRAQARAAEARVEQVAAQVDERRADLDEAVVRAPVDGLVGRRDVEVGTLVDSGTTLFVLGGLDHMVVEIPFTDDVVERIGVGTPVHVQTRNGGREPIEAEISRISPFLRTESFSTMAEVEVSNAAGRLRPGMFVTATVLLGRSEQATLLPSSVLWEDPGSGEFAVFVLKNADGLAEPEGGAPPGDVPAEARETEMRSVRVLARGGGTVGLEGVEEGEWVVTVGQHLLRQQAAEQRDSGEGTAVRARVRPASWSKVLGLQSLQREDLLNGFLDKQQRIARALGAKIPESESVVEEVLAESAEPENVTGPQGS